VSVTMILDGPLSFLWEKILGSGQQKDLEAATAGLIEMAKTK